jgi:hypothetical protein
VKDIRKYGTKLVCVVAKRKLILPFDQLEKYADSLIIALQSVYPEYNLLPWKFNYPRKLLWEGILRYFVGWLANKFTRYEIPAAVLGLVRQRAEH